MTGNAERRSSFGLSLGIAAIIGAATIGDGIFALPYVFAVSGWAVVIGYLVVVTLLVGLAQIVYFKTLETHGEKERLLELVERYFGRVGFWIGFVAIVIGLLFSLVAFLILGSRFLMLAIPGLSPGLAFFIFWIALSLPIFISDRRVAALEVIGISCATAIIIFIFGNAWPNVTFAGVPAATGANLFLPFSVALFSLAGWTGIEPAYELRKRAGSRRLPWKALLVGTASIALLYVLFAAGVLGSTAQVTGDTVSGLAGWPFWKQELIALFGLVAIATVYLPISREIKNALEKDLRWDRWIARSFIILLPVALIGLGLRSFLTVVSVAGGLFISVQYLLIIGVGRRALALSRGMIVALDAAAVIFLAAIVYEVASFIVH